MGTCSSRKNNNHVNINIQNDQKEQKLQNNNEDMKLVYVIGCNENGELGIKHNKPIFTLTSWNKCNKSVKIKSIHCTMDTIIFNDNNNNYWVAGNNEFGQCGINNLKPEYSTKCRQITHFKAHNIKITKICTNVSSQSVFWITNKHRTYGHGRNSYYELGLNDKNDRIYPELIKCLTGVIDIQCANKYSIALCTVCPIVPLIIQFWLRDEINWMDETIQTKVNILLPEDIIQLTQMFCDANKVYKTRYTPGLTEYNTGNKGWQTFTAFEDKNIVKISCGINYSLLLDNEGVIWCYGMNDCGQLGLNRTQIVNDPTKLKYFSARNVWIKDIKCGQYHSVVLDENGDVHLFGDNRWFQLSMDDDHITSNNPKSPKILQGKNIVQIGCGSRHSFAMTHDGIYYLWGSNWYNECLQFGLINTASPDCDDIDASINNLSLGNQSTILITDSKLKT